MSKTVRRIATVLSLILLTLLLSAAVPLIVRVSRPYTEIALAEEEQPQPADEAETRIIAEPEDVTVSFNGFVWNPGESLTEIFNFVKYADSDGNDVTKSGAKDAGEYTVTVVPAENCAWADGSEQKTFKLTIEKAELEWMYKDEVTQELTKEFIYSWNNNRVYEISAVYGNWTYSKETPYDNIVIIQDENTETPIQKNVTDAGTYTFTVADAGNYVNPTFTLNITRKEVNISDPYNLKWMLDASRPIDLSSGRVYEYSYNEAGSTEEKRFYAASEMDRAPYSNWENWKDATKYEYTYNEKESTEVKTYVSDTEIKTAPNVDWENWKCVFAPSDDYTENKTIYAYRENVENAIKLNNTSGSMAFFEVDYGGVCRSSQPGRYEAKAVIKAAKNYTLAFDTDEALGMDVVDNGDGTYSITKVWFILQYFNEFLDRSSAEEHRKEEYSFPESWVYGKIPENVNAPSVAHGDEIAMGVLSGYIQPDGYSLAVDLERVLEVNVELTEDGEDYQIIYAEGTQGWQDGSKDIVTFTITCGNVVICKDQPRSKFAYYVNEYMPVGEYTITFTAKNVNFSGSNHLDWWSGFSGVNCGDEYIGTSLSFDFEVYADDCIYDDLDLNFNKNDTAVPFGVDIASIHGDYANFFAVTSGKTYVSGAIKKSEIAASDTYWAEVADEYFDEAPYLTYSLVWENAQYLPASSDEWAALVPEVGTYRIYYQINMHGYNSLSVTDGGKYFDIILYEVLEIPEFVIAEYTGSAQAVTPAEEDARYTISGNVQTEIGFYTATLTLKDPVHYRWKDTEGAVCEAGYSIGKATNKWLAAPDLADYRWNSFVRTENVIEAMPVASSPVFSVTRDAEGLIAVVGLENFTADGGAVSAEAEGIFNSLKSGTYYLWCSVAETETHKPIEKAAYEFAVLLADNVWVEEPDIESWTEGKTPASPKATAKYGTVTFKIVSEHDENDVYYDAANGINKLAAIKAGTYVLVAEVAGSAGEYKSLQATKTFVVYSSLDNIVMIFLYIIIGLLACAVIVLVILLVLKHKKDKGNGGEPDGGSGDDGNGGDGGNSPEAPEAPEQPEEEAEETPQADESEPEEQAEEPPAEEEQPAQEQLYEEQEVEESVYEQQAAEAAQQSVYGQPVYDMYGRQVFDIYGNPVYEQPAQSYYAQPEEQTEELEEIPEPAVLPEESEEVFEEVAEEQPEETAEQAEEPEEVEEAPAEELAEETAEEEQPEEIAEEVEEVPEPEPEIAEEPAEPEVAEQAEETEEIQPPVFEEQPEEIAEEVEEVPEPEPEVAEQAEEAEEIQPPVFGKLPEEKPASGAKKGGSKKGGNK